ncbi:MAG: phosphodiester glycosidase family protein [Bacillota bacterium]
MRNANRRILVYTVIFTLMALSLTFLAPSGAILPEAAARYQEEADTEWTGGDAWDYTLGGAVRRLASAGLTDVILPVNSVSYLPLDREEPGRVPVEENFTETSYSDETIIVELTEVRQYDSTFHVAYVKIATPTQLRTAVAGKLGSSRTLKPTVFSKSMNAVLLINGDYYIDKKAGYIVRQGETYRQATSDNMDLLLIDENADFHIIGRGKSNQKVAVATYLQEHEIINGFFFGPALVVDAEQQEIPENYQFNPYGDEPRAAIGQLAPLTYVLVTVDGRIANNNGITVEELAAFMHELGCEQAYALDGGNSSALVFHHQLVSVKDVNERDVSDVIYFASAIDN